MSDNKYACRVQALRDLMAAAGISAVIVPQADPHMSEYLGDHWQLREWLSGFSGSAGTLVVTADKALLWTDSRYFIQAAQQLAGSGIELMKDGLPDTPSMTQWLVENLSAGDTVAFDGMLMSLTETRALAADLAARGIKLDITFDPAQLWEGRPELSKEPILLHDVKYAGEEAADKIAKVLANARKAGADAAFISALDEIAWILNIRGRDVTNNPVATCYLYVNADGAILLIDGDKVPADIAEALSKSGVRLAEYAEVKDFVRQAAKEGKVLLQAARNSAEIARLLGDSAVEGDSPCALLKACKNDVQIAGVRQAMERDGVALVGAVREIKDRVASGEGITELTVSEILLKHRSAQPLFFDESFGTIAGYGPHGAIVHYEATEESASTLEPKGLLLIDSGAQYFDGTTDITRTIALGEPTADERTDYTLVLKGHIALGTAVFPQGIVGMQLDALARQFLWQRGLTYLHGTGHGVGHFLNVHEGPHSIRLNYVPTPLQPGMITSNEPGLYREGVHGIRIENLVLTVPAMTTEFGQFYKFETLTLFPYDRSLIDLDLLSADERAWIDAYHRMVYDRLSPALGEDDRKWLADATAAL